MNLLFVDNVSQISHSSVSIRILDVNDNPPELARPYEASICEDIKPGQVRANSNVMHYYHVTNVLQHTHYSLMQCFQNMVLGAPLGCMFWFLP